MIIMCSLKKKITDTLQKLRILQYNIHKLRNKMIIIFLYEKIIKNYNILMS